MPCPKGKGVDNDPGCISWTIDGFKESSDNNDGKRGVQSSKTFQPIGVARLSELGRVVKIMAQSRDP